METLTFLVNNLNKDIDFKTLRDAFRTLDKSNTGLLSINEIKEAFKETNIPAINIEDIFKNLDI